MEKLLLLALRREKTGKSSAKKLRKEGIVPAVVYKDGRASCIAVKENDLLHLLHKVHLENAILELEIKNGDSEKKTVILKEIQYHPFKGSLLHVDFQEISLKEVIRVKVPVEIKGEAIGVKRDGGILEHLLREIEIECKAEDIPEKIEVDVSSLEIGDSISVGDLNLPANIKILEEKDKPIVHLIAPKVVEEVPPEEIKEEAEEPEVIKQKKEEEGKEE